MRPRAPASHATAESPVRGARSMHGVILVALTCAFVANARAVRAQCDVNEFEWPFFLGHGEYYNESPSVATETTYFLGWDSYAHWDGGTQLATNYKYSSTAACLPPPPPAPPPPPPPPPAQAAFKADLQFSGYTKAEMESSVSTQTKLKNGIAAFLNVTPDEITIDGFEELTTRRRNLLATFVKVLFSVNAPTFAVATTLAQTMNGMSTNSAALLTTMKTYGLPKTTALTVTPLPANLGLLAPPPSPPPPPPSPPPECGNGVLVDGEDGCDQGWNEADLPPVWGCVDKCTQRDGWVCSGKVANGIEYGAFDANAAAAMCNCSNPAGTYALSYGVTQEEACAMVDVGAGLQFPTCLYPARCLANGAGCAEGAEGVNCKFCQIGYYKSGDICAKCGDNTMMNIILAIVCISFFGVVGFKTADKLGNTSISIIKNMMNSLQFFSISLSVDMEWPRAIVELGEWFKAFNFNIEFVAPECVAAGGISWATLFWTGTVVVPGGVSIFLYVLDKYKQYVYDKTLRNIHSEVSDDGETTNYWIEKRSIFGTKYRAYSDTSGEKIVINLQKQYRSRAALKAFGVLCMTVMYLPVVRVSLQAYDCTETSEGFILTYDPKIFCTDSSHIIAQAAAAFFLGAVGIGLPFVVIYRVRKIRLQGKLDDAQTIDTYGALYDVYRRPDLTATDKLEIAVTAKKLAKQHSEAKEREEEAKDSLEPSRTLEKSPSRLSRVASMARSSSKISTLSRDGSKLSRSKSIRSDDDEGGDEEVVVIDKETKEFIEEIEREEREAKEEDEAEAAAAAEAEAAQAENGNAAENTSNTRSLSRGVSARSFNMRKSFAAVSTFKRSASARARDAASKMPWRDRFALYYLSLEMFQKLGAVLGGSPSITESLAAYGLTFVFGFTGIFVAWAQPWRIMSLGFGKLRITNTLNRVESVAMILQALVTVMPVVFENYSTVITTFVMGVVFFLLSIRIFMFISERLGVKRDKRMDLVNKPEEAMAFYHDTLIKFAKYGSVVRMYSQKYDFGVQRRKVRARMESTRDAMLKRIKVMKADGTADEQSAALYKIANDMATIVNALTSNPVVEGDPVETRIALIEDALEHDLSTEEQRDATSERELHAEALNLTSVVHAYDKARYEVNVLLKMYAQSEMVSEMALLGGADRIFAAEQAHCPVGFGAEKLLQCEAEFTRQDAPYVEKLMAAIDQDDIDGTIDALSELDGVILKHFEWVNAQIDVFDNPGNYIDCSKVLASPWALDISKRALLSHVPYLQPTIEFTARSWSTLFKEFGNLKYGEYFRAAIRRDMELRSGEQGQPPEELITAELNAIRDEFEDWCRQVVTKLGQATMNQRFSAVSEVIAANVAVVLAAARKKLVRKAKRESRALRNVGCFGR